VKVIRSTHLDDAGHCSNFAIARLSTEEHNFTRPSLMAEPWGALSPLGAILVLCRLGLGTTEEVFSMCDYSLHTVKSRPAKVGDKLTTHNFYTGTRGFAAPEDPNTAVCVLPGTELAFAKPVMRSPRVLFGWKANMIAHTTAIFRQVNKDNPRTHHDALEFPDGQIVLLTHVLEYQEATVLQLPAQPATAAEAKAQERVALVG
jgi:hypothetical protein